MNTGKIITLVATALGLYVLYEWLTSQCETVSSPMFGSSTCSMLLGTSALPAVTVPTSSTTLASTTPVVTTAAPTTAQTNTANLAAQLTQAATNGGYDPTQLSADQWSYFYQQIPGKSVSPSTFENILQTLGLSDATRATFVTATQFAAALGSNGLSGFGTFFPNRVSAGLIHGGWA
jgi:hypothetical protein